MSKLRLIEGQQVTIALRDGTLIDDCNLVSSGRSCLDNLWLIVNGEDVFVACSDVADVWQASNKPSLGSMKYAPSRSNRGARR
jgi:hypothetical protein